MKLTSSNLNRVLFENEDARLLIEDVVTTTDVTLLYFDNVEVSTESAIKIWYNSHHYTSYKASLYDRNSLNRLCS